MVAGPSISKVTLLPAIRGTPVAASSWIASAFMSGVARAQRRASRADACLVCSGPLAVATVGMVLPLDAGSTSGRVAQALSNRARPSASAAIGRAGRPLCMVFIVFLG